MSMFLVLLLAGAVYSQSCPNDFGYCSTGRHGDENSGHFDDYNYFFNSGCAKITSIQVWSGDRVDGLQFTYGTNVAPVRGSQGGTGIVISLAANENIFQVRGKIGHRSAPGGNTYRLGQITFVTNVRTIGPYGNGGSSSRDFEAIPPSNEDGSLTAQLVYIKGRSGSEIDIIEFLWEDPVAPNCDRKTLY